MMEDFESEYAEELQMVTEDSALSVGLSSRRSLDLSSPFLPPSSRKRPLSSESPLPAPSPGPPHKVQCLDQEAVPAVPSPSLPPTTPSRPTLTNSATDTTRPRNVLSTIHKIPTPTSDQVDDSVPSPPSSPCSPPLSPKMSNSSLLLRNEVRAEQSKSSNSQQVQGRNESSTDDNPGTSRSSLMERFSTVYESLTAQIPCDDIEDDLYETDCVPALDRIPVAEGVPLSSGVLTRAPAGPHVTVTNCDGRRVYLKVRSSEQLCEDSLSSVGSGCLLPVSFSRLRSFVQEERRRRLIEQSEQLLQSLTSAVEDDSQSLLGDGEEEGDGATTPINIHSLWVDKYAPRHYTHLLSDDGINRTLLSWMKLWDETVFGHSSLPAGPPGGADQERGGGRGRGGRGSDGGRGGGEGWRGRGGARGGKSEWRELADPVTFASVEALDETRRPKLKVALLCGAPGLGKTTLAHIIARHAGYQAVEMNASDDRSADVFRQKLEATTQMQAVLTPDRRPTCLIVDEIDGAPTAAINVLIDLVKRTDTGKKKKKHKLLSRPVICICNDQYAPSLRQLRQVSLVLMFPPTLASRLASRLQQVIHHERMVSSISTLMALCEKADSDIRACLNTLQFISKQQQELTLGLVQSASIGQKDAQMSLFSLWKEIFQLPSAKRRPVRHAVDTAGSQVGQEVSAAAARFYHMLSAASSTGEYDKVCNGLFENYLNIRFKDPNLEAMCVGLDWMVFHDTLQQHIAHTQNYTFWSYLPFLSVAFHFLFAAPSKPYIRYPHTNFEMFQKKQQSEHLLSSVVMEVPPHIRRMLTPAQLAVEMLCPILEIVTPFFRPVSTQLYSAREKQQLTDLIDTMISYGLTYKQEKGSDGQYTYILDPCLEIVCRLPGLPQRKQLSYSAKQLIAREVEVEKMRRTERLYSGRQSPSADRSCGVSKGNNDPATASGTRTGPVKEKPAVDFFGRKVQPCPGKAGVGVGRASHTDHPLWFRFNEGFSNAVRRPVRIQDLL